MFPTFLHGSGSQGRGTIRSRPIISAESVTFISARPVSFKNNVFCAKNADFSSDRASYPAYDVMSSGVEASQYDQQRLCLKRDVLRTAQSRAVPKNVSHEGQQPASADDHLQHRSPRPGPVFGIFLQCPVCIRRRSHREISISPPSFHPLA